MMAGNLPVPVHNGCCEWPAGEAPVAVLMITLNEANNLDTVLRNITGWAQEVFVVDSYSQDATIDIALRYGVKVVQRKFRNFGDQWNFALEQLPIRAPWTMKLDPDERLSPELKSRLRKAMQKGVSDGFSVDRQLWFMGRPMPVRQRLVRVWRTGKCRFTDIAVNEHPIVDGSITHVLGTLAHHDSPDLDHWLDKQNRYTTTEAVIAYERSPLADHPLLLGTSFQRRMWAKKNFDYLPFRFLALFLYHWLLQGAWRAGWVGYAWSRLRCDVMRLREYKRKEMEITGRIPSVRFRGPGHPDNRVRQCNGIDDRDSEQSFDKGEFDSSNSTPERASAAIHRSVRFHDTLAKSWTTSYSAGGFRRRVLSFRSLLATVVRPGEHWLDAGCGTGVLAVELSSLGALVTAVDASRAMIGNALGVADGLERQIAYLVVESIEHLGDPDSTFDGVVCSSVIEYVDHPENALRELYRVTKPGGRIVVSLPNRWAPVRVAQKLARVIGEMVGRNYFEYLTVSRHHYSKREVRDAVSDSGYVIKQIEVFDSALPKWLAGSGFGSLFIVVAEKPIGDRNDTSSVLP